MSSSDPAAALKQLKPTREFFVGIDSDGCVFDTMEIKHKECFIPNIIKYYKLQAISKFAREAGEFVNLYSKSRGCNRWLALVEVMDLLTARGDVQRRGVKVPQLPKIREFIDSGRPLSNSELAKLIEETGDAEYTHGLEWSEAVNATIEDMVEGVPPFPYVRESLEKAVPHADCIVVSQTPTEALEREWKEHSIDGFVHVIAGQEMGKKSEHLELAAGGKYPPEKILMIGDAPGDRKAAEAVDALFYPINPGHEDESWQRFYEEAFDKFVGGTFAGDYQKKIIDEFEALLPELPPWKR